jgi:hypothetical protein
MLEETLDGSSSGRSIRHFGADHLLNALYEKSEISA